MYTTDTQVLTDLAGVLKQPSNAALLQQGPFWYASVALYHLTTYNDIFQALATRGYTQAQILAWDQGVTFERVLSVYNCLVANGVLSRAGADFVSKAERYLKELHTVTVTIGGVTVDPLGTAGQVGVGPESNVNDIFVWPPPNVNVTGEPTRW